MCPHTFVHFVYVIMTQLLKLDHCYTVFVIPFKRVRRGQYLKTGHTNRQLLKLDHCYTECGIPFKRVRRGQYLKTGHTHPDR